MVIPMRDSTCIYSLVVAAGGGKRRGGGGGNRYGSHEEVLDPPSRLNQELIEEEVLPFSNLQKTGEEATAIFQELHKKEIKWAFWIQ